MWFVAMETELWNSRANRKYRKEEMPRKQRKRSMSEADQQRLEHRNTSDNDSDKEETAGGVSSASERKLFAGLFEDASEHTTAVQDSTGFRLVHFQSITQSIVEAAVCRLCKKGKLILQESLKNRQGFHVPMEFACSSCKETTPVAYSHSSREESPRNQQESSTCISSNWSWPEKDGEICAMMNMPPPLSHRSYDKHVAEVCRVVSTVVDKEMRQSAMRLQSSNISQISRLWPGRWAIGCHSQCWWKLGNTWIYLIARSCLCHLSRHRWNPWFHTDEPTLPQLQLPPATTWWGGIC